MARAGINKKQSYIVGLTGGIATGKTTMSEAFRQLGANVVCCDEIAHRALRRNTGTYKQIIAEFGGSVLDKEKRIDRQRLAKRVFDDEKKIKKLEKIIHPYVFEKVKEYKKKTKGILIIDIPLLFETEYENKLDRTIVVSCSEKKQLERLMARNGFSKLEAEKRIAAQMPLREKKKKADWIINNNSLKQAIRDVNKIWEKIKNDTA